MNTKDAAWRTQRKDLLLDLLVTKLLWSLTREKLSFQNAFEDTFLLSANHPLILGQSSLDFLTRFAIGKCQLSLTLVKF